MRFSNDDDGLDGPIEPPYRPLELAELKAKGVKVRLMNVDHEHAGLFATFRVEHKTNPKTYVMPGINMLCDLFSRNDGPDCAISTKESADGEHFIMMTVPAQVADRLDASVVPALNYLNDEPDDGFRAPTFKMIYRPR